LLKQLNTYRSAKVQKRASNVLKLSLEHQKLEEELRAMNERLKALEQAASQRRSSAVHPLPSELS